MTVQELDLKATPGGIIHAPGFWFLNLRGVRRVRLQGGRGQLGLMSGVPLAGGECDCYFVKTA